MAIRKIFTDDAACLKRVCRPVTQYDARLGALLDDLAETMYQAEGCGLAASQVGVLRRAAVVDCGDGLVELVNPEVLERGDELDGCFEGCLSFPGQRGYVERPLRVKVRAYDRKGEPQEYAAEGLFARALQHEIDHLDGLVYTRLITEPPEGYEEEESDEEDEA
jgi:peptide deformylase